jgi:uncharacterized protein
MSGIGAERDAGEGLAGVAVENKHGTFLMVETRRGLGELRRRVSGEDVLEAGGEALALAARDAEFANFETERALFIDTETTGLAGGTGTYAFLVGVGFVDGAEFVVRQYFMRDLSEEKAMMAALAELLAEHDWSVTYNGRSFDLPLLRTRFIMSRQRPRIDHMGHLDLLHSARRLWGRSPVAANGLSLGALEAGLFAFERGLDVPGWQIPELYLAYLRDRDPEPLRPVLAHNVEDIVTMAALLGVIQRAVAGWEEDDAVDPYLVAGLGRTLAGMGRAEQAGRAYRRALSLGLDAESSNRVALDLSILLKRDGDWEGSVELWRRVAEGRGRIAALACVELAKFYEHRARVLDSAREMCDRARQLSEGDQDYWGGQLSDGELSHRRGRLARKLAVPAAAGVSKVPAAARPGRRFRRRT